MMNTAMTPTETSKHFRNRLRAAGIKARCSTYESCGSNWVRVSPPAADATFSDEQQFNILLIAQACHLTLARGMEIDIHQMTYTHGGHFVVPCNLAVDMQAASV